MKRREMIRGVGLGAVALGSGCSALPGPDEPPYLEQVALRNVDGISHEFELTIERNDSDVFETIVELHGSRRQGEYEDHALKGFNCEWSGRGPFVVLCSLDDRFTEAIAVERGSEDLQGKGDHASVTFKATGLGRLEGSAFLDDGGLDQC